MGSFVLPTMKTKREVDTFLMNTLDKVAVLRFSGKYSPSSTSNIDCVLLDDIVLISILHLHTHPFRSFFACSFFSLVILITG